MRLSVKSKIAALATLASMLATKAVMAAPAEAIAVTDYTGSVSAQQASLILVVGAGFVLLGIVVGVGYLRRAAK